MKSVALLRRVSRPSREAAIVHPSLNKDALPITTTYNNSTTNNTLRLRRTPTRISRDFLLVNIHTTVSRGVVTFFTAIAGSKYALCPERACGFFASPTVSVTYVCPPSLPPRPAPPIRPTLPVRLPIIYIALEEDRASLRALTFNTSFPNRRCNSISLSQLCPPCCAVVIRADDLSLRLLSPTPTRLQLMLRSYRTSLRCTRCGCKWKYK